LEVDAIAASVVEWRAVNARVDGGGAKAVVVDRRLMDIVGRIFMAAMYF